ncbi:MAG: zinc-ribbon domain-containing protein, partial [Thermoplasmata archaeon]
MKVCRICTAVLGDDEFCPICGTPSREPKKGSRPNAPRAEPLPEFDESTGSCLVCGIPLRGGICEMCGSPRMSVKDRELEFRCPFCEEPVDPNATRCPHCGIDYVSREKEKDINYRCPMCGEEIDPDSETCPKCGVGVWIGEEDVKESAAAAIDSASTSITEE